MGPVPPAPRPSSAPARDDDEQGATVGPISICCGAMMGNPSRAPPSHACDLPDLTISRQCLDFAGFDANKTGVRFILCGAGAERQGLRRKRGGAGGCATCWR